MTSGESISARAPGKHAVAFVFVTVFLDMVGFGLVMPVLPKLIENVSGRDLAGASLLAGWLFFAYGGMQFLFGPVIGNLSDAHGRRPVLLLSVAGLAVDYLLTAFAPTMIWLFVGRIIGGLCGASYITANAYLADITTPENRAKAFGLMGAAFGFGFIIGPAIGGLLGEFGPRVPFFVAAGVSGLNLVYGYLVLPETLPPEKRRRFSFPRSNPLGAFNVFAKYQGMTALLAVMSIYLLAHAVYPAIWAFWGIARFGWSEATIGLTLAAYGLAAAIVQGGLTGPAVKWLGERNAVIFGLIIAAIAAAGYGLTAGLVGVVIVLAVHSLEGFVYPALTALMSKLAPADAQGELQGGIASLQSVGMLAGTVMFTQVFGFFMGANAPFRTPNMAFYLTAVLTIVALGIFLMQRTRASLHGRA